MLFTLKIGQYAGIRISMLNCQLYWLKDEPFVLKLILSFTLLNTKELIYLKTV